MGQTEKLRGLSYTSLQRFLRCPLRWQAHYLKGLPEPESAELLLGRCYHQALSSHYQRLREGKATSPSLTLEEFESSWREIPQALQNDKFEALGSQAGKALELYLSDISILPSEIEAKREVAIGELRVSGVIDLITNEGMVVEHKLRARSLPQEEADQHLQPSVYALLLGRSIEFEFHVAVATKNSRVDRLSTRRDAGDISWVASLILGVWEQIGAGIFYPRPGWWCRDCPFTDGCHHTTREFQISF